MSFVKNNSHWLLIILGTLVWSVTMVKSGLVYNYGMGFWGANGHDGIWHISLINSLSKGNLGMPIFAGETIKNYHLGFDIIVAILHATTRIPAINLYFQIIPPLLAFGVGWSAYSLVLDWTKNSQSALWAVFFTYFGGSWGWVFRGGESMFWSQQSISTLINPPFALSLIILFLGLRQLHRKSLFWSILLFGSLAAIKIYASVLILAGLAVASLISQSTRKVFIGSLLVSLALFLPLNSHSSGLLVWQPGWFLETMMAVSDRVNWPKFYSAMTSYKSGHDLIKFPLIYGVALLIFLLGNFGTRIVGLFKAPDPILTTTILLGTVLPMLFLQTGTPWNTIQFFYYSLALTGLLAGIAVSRQPKWLAICTILLTVPTTLDSLKHYLPSRPPAMVSHEELAALNFLSKQPSGVVLSSAPAIDPYAPAPRPLYQYESTAYVSALSRQPGFVEDYVNLNITGFDWQTRKDEVASFFTQTNPTLARKFLFDHNIKYIYLSDIANIRPLLSASELGGTSLFENSQAAVWKLVQ